ncbi:MAG: hypothetical protein LLG04_06160 [Parachlamydia sp.]|nr:hypothetical protein [Parachlamydia sp.]
MIASDYKFCFENYLTKRQQSQFAHLSKTGQSLVRDFLLSSGDAKNLERVRRLFSIMPYCQEQHGTADNFFQTLLASKDSRITDCLAQVLEICEKGAALSFFQCAETKQDPYYSAETLIQMTSSFHSLLQARPSLDLLSPCPGYSEGGKELLERLKTDLAKERVLPVSATFGNGSLKEIISRATSYLTSLPPEYRLSMEIYLKFFQKLQHDPALKGVNPFEILNLALKTTTGAGKGKRSLDDLWQLALEAAHVQTVCGKEVLAQFCASPNLSQAATLDSVIYALRLMAHGSHGLEQFARGKLDLAGLIQELEDQSLGADFDPDAKEGSLMALMRRFAGDDSNVAFPLSSESLQTIEEQYSLVLIYCREWRHLPLCTLVKKASGLGEKPDDKLKLMAIGRLAIRHIFRSIYLHNTQMLTVIGLLLHPQGCMAQVKTGEGKTMIVNLQAFVLSKMGKQVHIMSSSRSLAERDQKTNAPFFAAFGFSTSHICDDNTPAECFQAPILYGTATDFEFAIMREMLFRESLFRQKASQGKRFENVAALVDEGDNQTIDTADSDARLSYPAEVTYDWVYSPIVAFMEKHKECSHEKVKELRSSLQEYRKGQFREEAVQLSDEQLKEWIQSANTALFHMKEHVDYVISSKVDKEGHTIDEVVIIDYRNTGEKLESSRWSKGLHECLEVMHAAKGKRIQAKKETLTPISLSRSLLFPMYDSTYFLTGTAGSKEEREGVKAIFGIGHFDVPTFRPSQREDKPPIIFATNKHYYQAFLQRIQSARAEERPFLGLFETIKETQEMEKHLKEHDIPYEVLNEIQLKDEEEILAKAGLPGKVLIATNTAGRGTDIKLEGKSRNKGLNVVFGYYPRSHRVEMQGRGRAGRQGEPGSSEILLSAEKMGLAHLTNIEHPVVQMLILTQLSHHRDEVTTQTMGAQTSQAKLKRHIFTFVQRFFDELETFMRKAESERFFREMAALLNNRRLKQKRSDTPAGLTAKDRVIAQEALRLLSSDRDELASWKSLIKSAVERMRDHAISCWSLHFHQEVDNWARRPILDPEQKITEIFNRHKSEWGKYLDPSGNGLLAYLRQVTGASLKTI